MVLYELLYQCKYQIVIIHNDVRRTDDVLILLYILVKYKKRKVER